MSESFDRGDAPVNFIGVIVKGPTPVALFSVHRSHERAVITGQAVGEFDGVIASRAIDTHAVSVRLLDDQSQGARHL